MKSFIVSTLLPLLALAQRDTPYDQNTSKGTFDNFIPAKQAAASATGGPSSVDPDTAKALQFACDNWTRDTGEVSNFQNKGKALTTDDDFKRLAYIAYVAEVDELAHKGILDQIIGNDPTVSVANLTLTNGVFQSVVDNLQIMSVQGRARSNLVDYINKVRCVQILPSIDAYCAVAARVIGQGAQLRKAVRPDACTAVLANTTDPAAYPNVPNVPGGDPLPRNPANGGVGGFPAGTAPTAGNNPAGSGAQAGGNTGSQTGNNDGGQTGTGQTGGNTGAGQTGGNNNNGGQTGGRPSGGNNGGRTGGQTGGNDGTQTGGQTGGQTGTNGGRNGQNGGQIGKKGNGGGLRGHSHTRLRHKQRWYSGNAWQSAN